MLRKPRTVFYGWPMVAVGFLTYGLGIAPAYYGLGVFASALIEDLELNRQQIGQLFGAFTFTYGLISPVAAAVIRRWASGRP